MSEIYNVDSEKQIITVWCPVCEKNAGYPIRASWKVGSNSKKLQDEFMKKHFYCNLDRNFQIEWIVLQLGRELDDKETTFAQSCMDEGMDRDRILELIMKKRQKSYPVTY